MPELPLSVFPLGDRRFQHLLLAPGLRVSRFRTGLFFVFFFFLGGGGSGFRALRPFYGLRRVWLSSHSFSLGHLGGRGWGLPAQPGHPFTGQPSSLSEILKPKSTLNPKPSVTLNVANLRRPPRPLALSKPPIPREPETNPAAPKLLKSQKAQTLIASNSA